MPWHFKLGMIGCNRGVGGGGGGGGGTGGATATAFLARTTGLDATHTNAYIALLDGLDADSLTSKLDVLHVYATQDSATALLNLVSSSFNGTSHGPPTFAADRGFTGTNGSSTVYIDTTFAPNVGTPQYTQNSAHCSAWSVTNVTDSAAIMGSITIASSESDVWPRHSSGSAFFRVQGAGATGFVNADGSGHYLANRTSSGAGVDGYKNGSSMGNTSGASQPVSTFSFYTCGYANGATAIGSAYQCGGCTIGAGLSGTDITNLYGRLRTYMTAVGAP